MSTKNAEQDAPTEADAKALVSELLSEKVQQINRFPTGMRHYVYDVVTDTGRLAVVRIADHHSRGHIAGALYWSAQLGPIGIPLPAIVAEDALGHHTGFAAMILERLPGIDLGNVYGQLQSSEKFKLAQDMVRIRQILDQLPLGTGFGFSFSLTGPWEHSSWSNVVLDSVTRSRKRIEQHGTVDDKLVDQLQTRFSRMEPLMRAVTARPFLDDATTKNVLMSNGQLSGIVDVDEICFGDPLFNVALTHASLLAKGEDTDYTDDWLRLLAVSDAARTLFRFYVAVFLLDFLSEIGLEFNRATPQFANDYYRLRLEDLLRTQLQAL